MRKYVGYIRVSTKKQDLGLDVQLEQIKHFVEKENGELIQYYEEKESGKKDNRIKLNEAISFCKDQGATLIVSKLDRLSRSVSFLFQLRDLLDSNKIAIKILDIPDLNTLTLGIFATMAQWERELISDRTKKALKSKQEQGYKLGRPRKINHKTLSKENLSYYLSLPYIPIKEYSCIKVAKLLNNKNILTLLGKSWTHTQVHRVRKYLGL